MKAFKQRGICFLVLIFILSMLISANSFADKTDLSYSSPKLFPLPKELEPAYKFWINIYSKYYTNEYVIHDSKRLDIIYDVVEFGSLNKNEIDLPQTRAQKNHLKNRMRHFKSLLLKLAAKNTKYDKLDAEQYRVFEIFGKSTDRSGYRTAAYNLRVQKGQKNRFRDGLIISGRYMPFIKEIFKRYNLPEELTVIPHVESSFNYRAYSSAGAAGLWQFTRGTGRRFLKISYEIDERLDPLLASEAAAKLLKENFQILGHWSLAITAYNSGTSGMKRAKKRLNTTDIAKIVANYKSRYFKFASRNFYCEFLAALHVSQNYQEYFGEQTFDSPLQFQEYELPHYVKYSSIDQYFNLEKNEIKKYNPSLRNPIFKGAKYLPKGFRIKLPAYINPAELYARIPQNELFVAQKESFWYRVRRGDTLSKIARRNSTSILTLTRLNNISNAHRIKIGERLQLPGKTKLKNVTSFSEPVIAQAKIPAIMATPEPDTKPTTVKPETSGSATTQKPVDSAVGPKRENNFTPQIDLQLGSIPDRVLLSSDVEFVESSNKNSGFIVVEPDETLGHYAKWLKIPTQKIRNWNDLVYGENIIQGQKLKIIFENNSAENFILARLEHHRAIEEDFFNNYRVVSTFTHKVKKGENIWYLCNYVYNLPYWVIKSYNSDLSLNDLNPGDLILIPEILEVTPNV